MQQTVERPDGIPTGPWTGLGVAFAYALVSLAVAFWLVRRRDAQPSDASRAISGTPASACETGQFAFAASAAARKPSSSRPDGPADSEHDLRDSLPWLKVHVALVFSCWWRAGLGKSVREGHRDARCVGCSDQLLWAGAPAGSPPARPT